jgi:hypothetical protein
MCAGKRIRSRLALMSSSSHDVAITSRGSRRVRLGPGLQAIDDLADERQSAVPSPGGRGGHSRDSSPARSWLAS